MKGFGKPKQNPDILVESMVGARSGEPLVKLEWGNQSGLLSPSEARAHAYGILEAAASAEIDAVIIQWAQQTLGMSLEQAALLRRTFRQSREAGTLPSCTLNIGGDRITPDDARQSAEQLMFMAFYTEMEACLARFLMQEVGSDETQVNAVIDELRQMRGLQRIDEVGT